MSNSFIQLSNRVSEFRDISLAWNPNPITGDLSILSNDRAVSNSIRNLLLIAPTEVPFRSDVGSTITSFLFENTDASTEGYVSNEAIRTIKYNEGRVASVTVNTEVVNNSISMDIRYTIVGYDEVYTFTHLLSPTK